MSASRAAGRRRTLWVMLAALAIPLLVAGAEFVSFAVRNASTHTMVVDGRERDYVLHLPAGYDARRTWPLVISMHGAALWGAVQRDVSRWNEVADREGIVVVYPSGAAGRGLRVWGRGDVPFIARLIDTLVARYHVDPARVYADGLSNGGGMAFVVSCALADRIAAVGLVGAAHTMPWTWCRSTRPVPAIIFHGTEDRQIPYDGGRTWIWTQPWPPVRTVAERWARRNGCNPTPHDSAVAPEVQRRAYVGCAGDADVVLYTIRGGGHTWPGGEPLPEWFVGRTSRTINASELMWDFYRRHPRGGT